MREIKFKVLNTVSNEISRHILTVQDILYGQYPKSWLDILDRLKFLQYTGLLDKNGTTYCQDDIVKFRGKNYRLIKGTYMFELSGFYESSQDNPADFFSENAFEQGETIGNIYENKNLLEDK